MPEDKISPDVRRLVRARANEVCEYCLASSLYSFHAFTIDHVVPISKGGKNDQDNLVFSCQYCNSSKYNKVASLDLLTGNLVPLFNPRRDNWSEHFIWNDGFSSIIGITPIGRATVICLKMNRESAQNLRTVLYQFGVHPPY